MVNVGSLDKSRTAGVDSCLLFCKAGALLCEADSFYSDDYADLGIKFNAVSSQWQ